MKNSLLIILFICSIKCLAQDPVFTQFFMIPETMSSSFTGGKKSLRGGLVHRTQWPSLDFKINSQYAFVDNWFDEINSGVGISILNHSETTTKYNFTQINLNYLYEVQLSYDWFFRPSISFGYAIKNFGFQNLLLEDQINIFSGTINPVSSDPLNLNETRNFFDFSTSYMFYNDDSWIGLSLRHLNQPNISLAFDTEEPLDLFMSLHASVFLGTSGYQNDFKLYGLMNLMQQGSYNRLDLGTRFEYDRFSLGILASTNPIRTNSQSHLLSSINGFIGMEWNGFEFGYSYDFNITNIGPTGGVYEISVLYDFGYNSDCFGCPDY